MPISFAKWCIPQYRVYKDKPPPIKLVYFESLFIIYGAEFNMSKNYEVTAQTIFENEKIPSFINDKDLQLHSYKVSSSPRFDEFLVM